MIIKINIMNDILTIFEVIFVTGEWYFSNRKSESEKHMI